MTTAPCRQPPLARTRLVVVVGGLGGQVAADQHVGRSSSNLIGPSSRLRACLIARVRARRGRGGRPRAALPRPGPRCGLTSKTTFLTVLILASSPSSNRSADPALRRVVASWTVRDWDQMPRPQRRRRYGNHARRDHQRPAEPGSARSTRHPCDSLRCPAGQIGQATGRAGYRHGNKTCSGVQRRERRAQERLMEPVTFASNTVNCPGDLVRECLLARSLRRDVSSALRQGLRTWPAAPGSAVRAACPRPARLGSSFGAPCR